MISAASDVLKSFISINATEVSHLKLPYHPSLCFSVSAQSVIKPPSNRRKKTTSSIANKKAKTDTKLKVSDTLNCANCDDDEADVKIESIVLHQMKHVLDAQARSNRDTAPIDRLLMCFFCGTASDNGCNVKCIKKPGKSANYEITADCLDGVIGGRFYVSLCNVTKSSPWANHPVLCNVTKCSETHWRWNIKNHYRVKHPNMKIPVTLEVSKFEEKCVEFIKGKYFRKKQMEMLLESYSEQTKALFPPKKKQQKKKKQKKKSDKRTMSSEDETASSDDNEDETTNNNNNESIAIDSDNNGMETTNNNNNEANVVLNAIDKDNKKKENQESDVSESDDDDDDIIVVRYKRHKPRHVISDDSSDDD
eukprot:258996_1